MAQSNFTKFATPVGVAVYPHLTVPDTAYTPEGSFHVKLALDAAAEETQAFLAPLIAELAEYAKDAKAADVKIKKYDVASVGEDELGDDGEPTGRILIKVKCKHNVKSKDGTPYQIWPTIFDSNNALIPRESLSSLRLYGGSKIRCAGQVVPYVLPQSKSIGLTLRLQAVQIVELSSGGDAQSPFEALAEGFKAPEFPAERAAAPESGEVDDGDY